MNMNEDENTTANRRREIIHRALASARAIPTVEPRRSTRSSTVKSTAASKTYREEKEKNINEKRKQAEDKKKFKAEVNELAERMMSADFGTYAQIKKGPEGYSWKLFPEHEKYDEALKEHFNDKYSKGGKRRSGRKTRRRRTN